MKKRGHIVLTILISVIVLGVILLSFRSIKNLGEKQENYEILNLKKSIETTILQQSVRTTGTILNKSFAVPSTISQACFFNPKEEYDVVRNPELISLFSEDVNNLFLEADENFIPYSIDNLELRENPLCAKIINNKITLQFTSTGTSAIVDAAQEDLNCITVLNNGDPNKKFDIVFVPYGFEETNDYNDQVNRYINNILLEFEPFKQHREKFNFYRIDTADIECSVKGFIQCDQYQLKIAASACPADNIVLLVDRKIVMDFFSPVRSSAIGNIIKINTADKPFVFVHEFGHTFGDLADEYVDENYYTDVNFNADDFANCDDTPCTSWSGIDGTGCFEECSLKKYFRPTESSIMRSLNSPTFGPVNEREIIERLLYYE